MITQSRRIWTSLASILGLCMIGYYNWRRIYGLFQWGFGNKEYSVCLIPFNEFEYYIAYQLHEYTLMKLIFFVAMGFIIKFILEQLFLSKKITYIISCMVFIVFMEVLVSFTSEMTVHIDANNIMLYSLGLFIGFWVYKLANTLFVLVLKKLDQALRHKYTS